MSGVWMPLDLVAASASLLLGVLMIALELNARIAGIPVMILSALQCFCIVRIRRKVEQHPVNATATISSADATSAACEGSNNDTSVVCNSSGFRESSADLKGANAIVVVPNSPKKSPVVVVATSQQAPATRLCHGCLEPVVSGSAESKQQAQDCVKDAVPSPKEVTSRAVQVVVEPNPVENKLSLQPSRGTQTDSHVVKREASLKKEETQESQLKVIDSISKQSFIFVGETTLQDNVTQQSSPRAGKDAQHNILAHFQRLTKENAVLDAHLKNSQEEVTRLRSAVHEQSLRLFRVSARFARLQSAAHVQSLKLFRMSKVHSASVEKGMEQTWASRTDSSAEATCKKSSPEALSNVALLRLFRMSARFAHLQMGSALMEKGTEHKKAKIDSRAEATCIDSCPEAHCPESESHSRLLSVSEMQEMLKAEKAAEKTEACSARAPSKDCVQRSTGTQVSAKKDIGEASLQDNTRVFATQPVASDTSRLGLEKEILAKFNQMVEERTSLLEEVSDLRVLCNQNASARLAACQSTARTRKVCSFSTQTDVSSFMMLSRPATSDSYLSAAAPAVSHTERESTPSSSTASVKNILARFSALEAEVKELKPRAELVPELQAERGRLATQVATLHGKIESRNREHDWLSKRNNELQLQLEGLRRLQGKEWDKLKALEKLLASPKSPTFQIKWPTSSSSEAQSPAMTALRRDMEAGGGAKLSIHSAPSDWRLRLQAALFSASDPVVLSLACSPRLEDGESLDDKMFGGFLWPAKETENE